MLPNTICAPEGFQSTPPARGATSFVLPLSYSAQISIHAPREGGDVWTIWKQRLRRYFNPRPPRGGRLSQGCRLERCYRSISIHAPREGGDFQIMTVNMFHVISIHAPREGGDLLCGHASPKNRDFNPRPPRGGRRHNMAFPISNILFQSTPPARGATFYYE